MVLGFEGKPKGLCEYLPRMEPTSSQRADMWERTPDSFWESCDLCHREDPAPEVVQDGARPARGQGVIAAWDTDPEVQWTGF